MDKDKAKAYVDASSLASARIVMLDIQNDFDQAMQNLLACPENELPSRRGEAVALQKILKRFEKARKVIEAERHGAT